MNDRIFKTVDKTGWGEGPWQTEPDRIEWTDEETGYECGIVRHPRHGQLNGYVGLPFDHPAWGLHYDNATFFDVEVHGGLTYADQYPPVIDRSDPKTGLGPLPEPDGRWWLGFDCGHYTDVSPGMEALLRSLGHEPFEGFPALENLLSDAAHDIYMPRYKPVPYVRAEVTALAGQLAAVRK